MTPGCDSGDADVASDLATKDSAIHVLQNKLHDAIAQNEEQAEQMDELFDMYNGSLRQQRTLELS